MVDKKDSKKLAEIIDMDADEIEKRLNNKKAFQIEFGQKGTNLTYQEKEKIENEITWYSTLPRN